MIAVATSIAISGQTFGEEWPERPAPVSFQRCSSYGVDLQIMSESNPENVVLGLFFYLPEDFPVSSKFIHFERIGDAFVSDASESFAVENATVVLIPAGEGYRLRIQIANIRLGDPLDPKTQMGSLVSRSHRDKVASYVEIARHDGRSEIVSGGSIPSQDGAFYAPTLITNVDQSSRLIQEEIFGPVLTVQTFTEDEQAIEFLNGTPYGLSCSLWTTNEQQARWAAQQARMGLVWVNSWFKRNLHSAFGGMKSSGIGREGGRYSLDFFSELKTTTWG